MLAPLLERIDAVAITGPTASGKSSLALQLAQEVPLEIISMDSAQVYVGMDIGTAKPSLAEQARVPHHLIDLRTPTQSYNAAEFVRDTQVCIAQIRQRGHLPLIVGGTMLYFKALMQGLSDLPPTDTHVRARIQAQAEQLGWPAMHAQLTQQDAPTAARLAPHDKQRIGRALEVIAITGKPLSSHFEQSVSTTAPRILHTSIEPERSVRWQRIEARLDHMLARGLVDEVRHLRAQHDLHADLPAMRCVGYRQVWQYLEGAITQTQLREQAIAATRQLAKRQMTWLRAMPHRVVVEDLAQLRPLLAV
jgi:tRNA dimethylallyltransferase